MNYYSFHIGDYKSHTNHLSLLEDLAYRRMLDMYYLTESPLPEIQKIARHICMRDNIDDIQSVLDEFFILAEDGYIHARCEREIQAMNNKSGKAKASAQARWERQRNANAQESQCERNANASKNHANASNLDANAMRNGCEGNAPNPNTHNPTPIPEKKEKSAYEESENPAPPPEPEPAYAKTDIQQPHTDNRTMFEMSLDWKPTANINGVLKFNGLPWSIDTIPNDRFVEFVTHWHGKPDRKTQDGWHGALAGWLKRTQHDKPKAAAGQTQKPNYQRQEQSNGEENALYNQPFVYDRETMGPPISEMGKITEEERERRKKISQAAMREMGIIK